MSIYPAAIDGQVQAGASVNLRIARQLERLSAPEREKLSAILRRLLELDEELADLHLCLPAVEIVFYLLDARPTAAVSLNPEVLLTQLEGEQPPRVRPR